MQEMKKIAASHHPHIALRAIPGHFVTPNAHINYYLDMTMLKSRQSEAKAVAQAMAETFIASTVVDTIVCLEGSDVIGAYLADELTNVGIISQNSHKTIYVTAPETDAAGQLIFRENLKPMITDKHVLLLLPTAATGSTMLRATDSIVYYGGTISGISAIFSAVNKIRSIPVHSLYTTADLPDYLKSNPEDCPLCKQGIPVDALANGYGYSILR